MLKILLGILLFSFQIAFAEETVQLESVGNEQEIVSNDDSFKHDKNFAKVQILNKITAKSAYLDIKVGTEKEWGYIKIKANACWQSSPYELTENKILLDIFEKEPDTKEYKQIFNGWMFSSSPAISTMENPIYDVVAVTCYD